VAVWPEEPGLTPAPTLLHGDVTFFYTDGHRAATRGAAMRDAACAAPPAPSLRRARAAVPRAPRCLCRDAFAATPAPRRLRRDACALRRDACAATPHAAPPRAPPPRPAPVRLARLRLAPRQLAREAVSPPRAAL
jgi:hypothetical protein